jgi:AraC-like DNA-binding protein/tetratricopeptide (TPR) repeat protein
VTNSSAKVDAYRPLPRAVRRVLDLMEAHCGLPHRLAELAAFAEVPPRTLQRQFRQFVGMSPLAKLRELRLERARRELLQAVPKVTVADIAHRCGFNHLGRFAIAYKRRHGEAPSTTLDRGSALACAPLQVGQPLVLGFEPPTVAVFPIDSTPDDAYIARGIFEELIAVLTTAQSVRVTESGAAPYRLFGNLRHENGTLRVSLRLIESVTTRLLWAGCYDGLAGQRFAFEEHVAASATIAIRASLRVAEVERAWRKSTGDLTAYEFALRALPSVVALERVATARAIDLLGEALARDPDQPFAAALAAWCHAQRVIYQFTTTPAQERAQALELAQRAAANLGADDAMVRAILGNAYNAVHDLDTAEVMVDRALALDGSSAWAWGRSGWIDVYRGRAANAVERLGIALRLNPADVLAPSFQVGLGCAHFQSASYQEAAHWLQHAVTERPSAFWAHRVLCPAYIYAGRKDEAQRSLAALRQEDPDITVSTVVAALPMTRDFLDRVAEGLEGAGLSLA